MCKLAISLLEMDYNHLERQIKEIENAGVDYIHIDVMDGNFVPNLGIGIKLIQCIRKSTELIFDVHMMVKNTEYFVEKIAKAGANMITIHYEACENCKFVLQKIKKLGIKSAIALNPDTSIEVLDEEILKWVDVVQLMTTYPGIEGQNFIPESIRRIKQTKKKIQESNLDVEIEVDGNINMNNVDDVVEAGASIVVSGRALVQGDIISNIECMKKKMQEAEKRDHSEICTWS